MKFMLIMQGTQRQCESMLGLSPAEIKAHIGFMMDLYQDLAKSGELVLAEGLDLPPNAKIVTAKRADAPTVSDGPFAETKEFLAGFWIVDVESQARALAIAAKASTAPGKGGAPMSIPIEVRQVMQAPAFDT
jgi:hypothetical protein